MKKLTYPIQLFSLIVTGILLGYTSMMSAFFFYADVLENNLSAITKGYIVTFLVFTGLFIFLLKRVNQK